MMKVAFFCGALFAVTAAQAQAVNLNGTWSGAGKITDNQGHVIPCEKVELTIVNTATVLNVSSAFTCAGRSAAAPGGNLDIRNDDLFQGSVKVGHMTDTSITLSEKDATHTMDNSCTFTDKDMSFKTVTTSSAEPGRVVTFEGAVHR